MAQRKKESKPVTLNLDLETLDKLEKFCEKEKRTKTSAVELAIEKYLEDYGNSFLKGAK